MIGCPQCEMARRNFIVNSGAMLAAISAAGVSATGAAAQTAASPAISPAGGVAPAARRNLGPIDFHTHMMDPDLPNLIPPSATSTHIDDWLKGMYSPDVHIAHMDRIGMGSHVLGYSNASQGITWGTAEDDLKKLRATNDRIAGEWVDKYPGRFHGAFGLPTQDMKLAVPELERAVTKLGMKVLQISSVAPNGRYFGEREFDPMWEACEHYGVTVFIHPHGQDNKYPFDDFVLSNSVGQGVEEVKVMASIIYQGVFDRFPNIKIVIAHGGGFLPHYYGRLDRNAVERPFTQRNISRLPSSYLKNFYYDSCVYSPDIMAALIRAVGIDRIVLGSDFPVGEEDGITELKQTPGLSADDFRKIAIDTPAGLLGL